VIKIAFGIKNKSGFLIVGLLVTLAAVSVLSGSSRKTEAFQTPKLVGQLVGVPGEFVFMRRLAFDIGRDSVSTNGCDRGT